MSTSQDFKTIFRYNLTCIVLSLRAKLKNTLQCETPCRRPNADSLEIENQTEGQDKIRICLVNEIRKPGLLLENSICRTNCGENLCAAVLKSLFSPSRIVHVFCWNAPAQMKTNHQTFDT